MKGLGWRPHGSFSKRMKNKNRSALWKPFTQMTDLAREEPLVIARGEGRWLVTDRGRRLYDGVSSLWANVHGHRIREIDQAIRRQLSQIAHTTLLGPTHEPAEVLAQKLVALAPRGLTRVFYSDNGSTAVEVALKMAFQYHRQKPRPEPARTRFLALTQGYDGDTLGAVGVGGIALFHQVYGPLIRRPLRAPAPHAYRCPLRHRHDGQGCWRGCLAVLERIVARHHRKIAAFVFEPLVQGAAGMVMHPPQYLAAAARLCRAHGILLVADEVATGFGRTGTMFACEAAGVAPDFLCLAKGLTGGYLPLAATLTTEPVYRAFLGPYGSFKAFFHGHTYSGNPLACAAALANLDLLLEKRVVEGVARKTPMLARALSSLARHPHVGEIRQKGFMVGIELVADRTSKKPFPLEARTAYRVGLACRARGLLLRPLGDVIVLMPPLTATARELAWMTEVVKEAIDEVTVSRPMREAQVSQADITGGR